MILGWEFKHMLKNYSILKLKIFLLYSLIILIEISLFVQEKTAGSSLPFDSHSHSSPRKEDDHQEVAESVTSGGPPCSSLMNGTQACPHLRPWTCWCLYPNIPSLDIYIYPGRSPPCLCSNGTFSVRGTWTIVFKITVSSSPPPNLSILHYFLFQSTCGFLAYTIYLL